jgi:hypothetical protein
MILTTTTEIKVETRELVFSPPSKGGEKSRRHCHLERGNEVVAPDGRWLFVIALLLFIASSSFAADEPKWATLKGQVTWDGPVPEQPKIVPTLNKEVCALDKAPLEEDFIVNPKNNGLKNVFVWIRPEGAKGDAPFPKELIHPTLRKPASPTVEIDQPCCRFVPHVLAARAGQFMIIKNSAPMAHNSKWSSDKNGEVNPSIAPETKFEFIDGNTGKPRPLVFEPREILLTCNVHTFMKAHIRVFDHPYFAVTDGDGKFEIIKAPVGKFSLYINHPTNGWLGRGGQPLEIKPGDVDLGTFKMTKKAE